MFCDRCRTPITRSENPDQTLCSPCLDHLRAGGAWALGAPTSDAVRAQRCVDLDLLPLRAHVLFGEVPRYPTDDDFHGAASDVFHEEDEPATHWRLEAVRWRLHHPGTPLDDVALATIAGRTAARLFALAELRRAVAS